jgi:EAL and modified HD-GYP domain-containing signal transduction protein
MATFDVPAKSSGIAQLELADGLRYMARQPILDLRGQVHGYELLFRAGPEAAFRGDGDLATRTVLDNTVLFGIEKLTCGLSAFVNCTMESLTGNLVHILPPSSTVLEILETLEPTPELIECCSSLKEAGYRIALDDFVWKPEAAGLVALADYIKVDFIETRPYKREELLKRLRGKKIKFIAEKVETLEDHQQACKEGFTLFQGYYFCRPVLLKNRKIPANRFSYIRILQLLHDDPLDLGELGLLVKQDASLTYRLLRLVNSPVSAIRQEVSSIESALVVVGEDTFRRIATLAIASELNAGRPPEILRMAFVRARFCEQAAELCGLGSTEQYLLGMVSLFPAILHIAMPELVRALPLRDGIREALLGVPCLESSLLAWAEARERADWEKSETIASSNGLSQVELIRCYGEAMLWAEAAMFSVA